MAMVGFANFRGIVFILYRCFHATKKTCDNFNMEFNRHGLCIDKRDLSVVIFRNDFGGRGNGSVYYVSFICNIFKHPKMGFLCHKLRVGNGNYRVKYRVLARLFKHFKHDCRHRIYNFLYANDTEKHSPYNRPHKDYINNLLFLVICTGKRGY